MLALAELQSRIRDTVLGASAQPLKGIVADDRLGYANRLNVYRNNTTILLREALAANFPVTQALVGEEFFANLARAYTRTQPPQSPCLFEYGNTFADFIGGIPSVQDLPYLADQARLEWARVEAHHADDAPVLDAALLANIAPDNYGRLTFAIHPAMRVVSSDFPVHAIWALHQNTAAIESDARVRLDAGGEAALITRPDVDVQVMLLGPGEPAFIRGLGDGATLGDAFAHAQDANAGFDAGSALTTLLTSGALAAYALTP